MSVDTSTYSTYDNKNRIHDEILFSNRNIYDEKFLKEKIIYNKLKINLFLCSLALIISFLLIFLELDLAFYQKNKYSRNKTESNL